jgi:hypothetical protein
MSVGDNAVAAAKTKLGAPYVWGSKGPSSFDCSGLFQWAWGQVGADVPGFTDAIADALPRVDGSPQPGDAILYRYSDPQQPGVRYPHIDMSEGGDAVIGARGSVGMVVEGHILSYPHEVHRPAGVSADGAPSLAEVFGGDRNWLAIGAAAVAVAWATDMI